MRLSHILSEFKIPKKWFDSKINRQIEDRECLGTIHGRFNVSTMLGILEWFLHDEK